MNDAGTVAKREPISQSILSFASRLADKADSLATRTHNKLGPVMQSVPPSPEGLKPVTGSQAYPPMFDELRERFNVIDRSLNSIEDALSRTEL